MWEVPPVSCVRLRHGSSVVSATCHSRKALMLLTVSMRTLGAHGTGCRINDAAADDLQYGFSAQPTGYRWRPAPRARRSREAEGSARPIRFSRSVANPALVSAILSLA